MSRNSSNLNSVFYAETYHPIQAGSIDGTDILPHDNAVYRALLCSSAGLYDPFGDRNVIGGDPYCTVFVGRLSHLTTERTLHEAMSRYGKVKNLRLVRHIVTGASRGFAFVEYESEREMRLAYEDAHHSMIDESEIIVDYNRQQLMPGWIPRRLGGGLGGKKESGQLRFGGRERPFRAPLDSSVREGALGSGQGTSRKSIHVTRRPIPWDDLKRLGIPPPPEGKYMSRFEVPSPPRQKLSPINKEDIDKKSHKHSRNSHGRERRSMSHDHKSDERSSVDRENSATTRHKHRDSRGSERRFISRDHRSDERSSVDREERSEKRHRHSSSSRPHDRRSTSHDRRSDERNYVDWEERSHKLYKHSDHKH